MISYWAWLGLASHVIVAAGAGTLCLIACRWMRTQWQPLGLVLGIGVLVRAWAGLLLFVISYGNLPVLSGLHTGDGFWHLAPDARAYYASAALAAGGTPVAANAPSPSFLQVLAVWMRLTGEAPVSPVLLNLLLYVGLSVLLAGAFRPLSTAAARRGALVSISAFSFSPVLVLLGTQTLKDVFFTFLIVCAGVALCRALPLLGARTTARALAFHIGIAAASLYLIAGVRAYYALIVWGAAAIAMAAQLMTLPVRRAVSATPAVAVSLLVLWSVFAWGAGPLYSNYRELISRTVGLPLPPMAPASKQAARGAWAESSGIDLAFGSLRSLRHGFAASGGGTNLAGSTGEPDTPLHAVVGSLAAVFVPASVLTWLSLAEFDGGRGLLAVTDVDTAVIGLGVIGAVWVILSAPGATRRNIGFVLFSITLSLVSAVLVGYVVTNYGTLFRLRLLAVVPFWILPLAVANRDLHEVNGDGRARSGAPQRRLPREVTT